MAIQNSQPEEDQNKKVPSPKNRSEESTVLSGAAISRLSRDLAEAAKTLSRAEARFIVDTYYAIQKSRVASGNQVGALSGAGEPHTVVAWLYSNMKTLEDQCKRALDRYTDARPVCRWARSIIGIGPVLSAGIESHVDITRCATAGAIWRFAGLDPSNRWLGQERAKKFVTEVEKSQQFESAHDLAVAVAGKLGRNLQSFLRQCVWSPKGEERKLTRVGIVDAAARRPWNGRLHVICWKIGVSFVKQRARAGDVYGQVYAARKAYEEARNESGDYAGQAAAKLDEMDFGVETDAYKRYSKGMLPQARIHLRAMRYAVKLFLAHYHHVAYVLEFGKEPPRPYIIEHGGHTNFIGPPNWPMKE